MVSQSCGTGDAAAQANLGKMYSTGEGVRQDGKEAVKWIVKLLNRET